jgi:leucyl aminopeptidase
MYKIHLFLIWFWALAAAAEARPFAVVAKGMAADAHPVLFATDKFVVQLTEKSEDPAAFDNIHVVLLERSALSVSHLKSYGAVLAFEENELAVIKVLPDRLTELIALLAAEPGYATRLVRLYGDPLIPLKPVVQYAPVLDSSRVLPAVKEKLALVDQKNLEGWIRFLTDMKTRFHQSSSGIAVASKVGEKLRSLIAPRPDITFTQFDHGSRTGQKSFIIRIEGTKKPDEIVIMGSHIDSVSSQSAMTLAPGADDDASGVAATMDLLRIIVEKNLKFTRTLEIHGYAAEEAGLVGSQHVAETYKAQNKRVIAMLQNDMNLFRSDSEDIIYFVSTNADSALTDEMADLIKNYMGFKTAKVNFNGGSSDHASWNKKGYASVFPTENPNDYNPNIHTTNDTISSGNGGDFTFAAAFVKVNLLFASIYGGLVGADEVPPADGGSVPEDETSQPKPQPGGAASSCSCSPDPAGLRCNLIAAASGEIVAWTPAVRDRACDESFCREFFGLSLLKQCPALQ